MLCSEESFEKENGAEEEEKESENYDENVKKHSFFPSVLLENDLRWGDKELVRERNRIFLKKKRAVTSFGKSFQESPSGHQALSNLQFKNDKN
jgi:hypothetical protein